MSLSWRPDELDYMIESIIGLNNRIFVTFFPLKLMKILTKFV